jgi:hypothetical protein
VSLTTVNKFNDILSAWAGACNLSISLVGKKLVRYRYKDAYVIGILELPYKGGLNWSWFTSLFISGTLPEEFILGKKMRLMNREIEEL